MAMLLGGEGGLGARAPAASVSWGFLPRIRASTAHSHIGRPAALRQPSYSVARAARGALGGLWRCRGLR